MLRRSREDVAALKISQNQQVSFNVNFASQQDLARKYAEEEFQAFATSQSSESDQMAQFLLRLKDPSTIRKQVRDFHLVALQAIRSGKSPIDFDTLNEELTLDDMQSRYVINVIASTPTTHFVIEIKYLLRPSAMLDTAAQLRRLLQKYQYYISHQRFHVDVVPILIVPASVNIPVERMGFVPVLKYDADQDVFVNSDQFEALVNRWMNEVTP